MVNDLLGMHDQWIRESNLIEGVDSELADFDAKEAFKTFIEKRITRKSILDCHWTVMLKLNHRIAGRYRKCDVRVGKYYAPDWKQVPTLMNIWLENWRYPANAAEAETSHILFERIHPFEDGNGRVGRIILNCQRLKAGLEPICYYANQREKYYRLFDNFDNIHGNKWRKLLNLK